MATTLLGGIANTIEERLSGGIRESLPRLDPVWKTFHDTYIGVTREGIGRAFQVIHTFSESLHGAFKWVAAAGAAVDNTTLTHSLLPGAVREYPGLEDTALPGYLQKTITLVEGLGNLFIPQQYLRAKQLEAAIGDVVGDLIRGCAQLVALADIACFYNTSSTPSVIGVVGTVTDAGTASPDITILGAVNMFYNGMHIDLYTSGGVKRNTNFQIIVDGVRYIPASGDTTGYGLVTLKRKDGVAFAASTPLATDLLVIQDSYNVGPHGPASWLINTGTAFGIDVAAHQQFQSVVQTSVGDLDETKLNRYFQRLWKAYGTMNFPDLALTSMGVTSAILDTSYGLADRFNRSLGERNQLSMGFSEPGAAAYMFNGIPIKWMVSPYMPSDSAFGGTANGGRLWAMKTRDQNLKRYTAPPLPGSKKNAKFGSEIEFPFGNSGPDGIFTPYHSTTGRLTEWSQAPFNRHVEYAPTYLPGLNLSGITEVL